MRSLVVLAVLVLVGCGADGAPVRPEAGVGVSVGPDGVTVKPKASVSVGPVTVSI